MSGELMWGLMVLDLGAVAPGAQTPAPPAPQLTPGEQAALDALMIAAGEPLSAAELAARLQLSVPATHLLLRALRGLDLIERAGRGGYRARSR